MLFLKYPKAHETKSFTNYKQLLCKSCFIYSFMEDNFSWITFIDFCKQKPAPKKKNIAARAICSNIDIVGTDT